jgi:phytol kinase
VSVGLQLALIILSVGGLLAAMVGVHLLAARYRWSAEIQRKCVHVTTGLYALSLPVTFSEPWPVLVLCAVSVLVMGTMRLPMLAKSAIGSTIHSVERKSYGEILLAVAIGFTFFRSTGHTVLYVLPILILTFSDAAAALTGVRYGTRIFTVEDGTKSLEGVVMFFLVTFILAMIALLLLTDIARLNVILLSFVVAVFGAQLEADSWRGFDNLFVPVGLHLFLANNLASAPISLLAEGLSFIAMLVCFHCAAPGLRLTRHAARSYAVLAFLILSVTALHNVILPLVAFIAFLMLRPIRPCQSPYPDLDFLACAAGVAALWLFAGELTGHNSINLYNLTFAGAATVFIVVAAHHRQTPAVALLIGLALAVIVIAPMNAAASRWLGSLPLWVAISMIPCAALPWLRPEFFDRYRSPRAFLCALMVPTGLLLTKSLST